jgi:hypothetical protein
MGNSDNTIPLCQLHRLQRFLKELQGASSDTLSSNTQLFWMDTFCVPTARQHVDFRRKAISSISKIFSNADKILVLDATLLEISCKDANPVELSIRILSSDWMRRLWTLGGGNARTRRLAQGKVGFSLSRWSCHTPEAHR